MSASIRDNPLKGLEVSLSKSLQSQTYLLGKHNILIEGFEMNVWHYLRVRGDGDLEVYWLFDRITTTLLNNSLRSGEIEYVHDDDIDDEDDYEPGPGDSTRVIHNEPHILFGRSSYGGFQYYHLNKEGNIYGGSNTYEEGYFCLGEAPDPFGMEAVEMFCNYESNEDLGWRGDPVRFKYNKERQNEITSWPTWGHRMDLPIGIKEFFEPS